MSNTAIMQFRINPQDKKQFTTLCHEIGVTPSQAYKMLTKKFIKEKGEVFDLRVPTEDALEAFEDVKLGRVTHCTFVEFQEMLKNV